MKKIIVNEWLKFVNTAKPKEVVAENVYRNGYWNVLQYNRPLEEFLIAQKIDYKITERPLT